MKTLLVLIALLLTIPSSAQTHIKFDLNAPFFNAFPASNRVVTLRALSPFTGNPISYTSDASGIFYHSNAAATDYAGLITRRGNAGEIPFQVTVSHTNLGVVNADAITSILGQQSYPVSGRSSWSIQAADQRFLLTPTNAATADDGQIVSKTGDKTKYIDADAGSVTYNLANSTNLPATSINAGTAAIDISGNAATADAATLASYVSGTLSNSITGNADTATTAVNLSGSITQSQVTGLPDAIAARQTTNSDYNVVTEFSTSGGLVTPGAAGYVGFTFTAQSNITVTALGRYVVTGNSNAHYLNIYRTNDLLLLGRAELATVGKSPGFHYVQLPVPVMLQKGETYAVTTYEQGTDQYYTIGDTVTTRGDITPQFGVGNTTPRGFSGWSGLTLGPVDFRYTRNAQESIDFAYGATGVSSYDQRPTLTAPRADFGTIKASLEDGYNGPATVDLSLLVPNTPSLGLDGWLWYYQGGNGTAGALPTQEDMIAWAVSMRTNGMVSAGWDILSVDDHWYWATNRTDGALLTNMNHFTNYAVVRDAVGVLLAHPTNFSRGVPAVIADVQTNGVRWRHYMPFRTNMAHFYKDVQFAAQSGADEFFLDATVGGETYFSGDRARIEHRRRVRTYQSAMLDAFENNIAGFHTNENRYMRLHAGGTAFGDQEETNVLFNADSFYGIQANTFSGEDVSTVSNVVSKVRKTWPWRWWIRPGYYPDFQLMAWSDSQTTNFYRAKLNVMAMGAGSMVTGPDSLERTVATDFYVLTNREFYAIWQDAAVSPAYQTYSNNLAEIWTRSLGHRSTGTNFGATNAMCLINITDTNRTLELNVNHFGGDSNVVYALRDPWFKTNVTFTDAIEFTVGPTNTHLIVVWPEGDYIAKNNGTAAVASDIAALWSGNGTYMTRFGTNADPVGSGDLLAVNNLNDVDDTGASRTNLVVNDAANLTEGTILPARLGTYSLSLTQNHSASVTLSNDVRIEGIASSRTNYTDWVEATNSSTLGLRGGGEVLSITSGTATFSGAGGFSGAGANLTGLNASQLTTGLVAPQRLAPTNSIPTDKTYSLHYQSGTNIWSEDTGGVGSQTIEQVLQTGSNANGQSVSNLASLSVTNADFTNLGAENFYPTNMHILSNAPPATPSYYGEKYFWNSNGQALYVVTAAIGSSSWDNTNLVNTGTSANAWALDGNAGITGSGTHFVGTTDNEDLYFKRNNIRILLVTDGVSPGAPEFIVGPGNSTIDGDGHNTITGGNGNDVDGQFNSIASGEGNRIRHEGQWNSIIGGKSNLIDSLQGAAGTPPDYSSILGGVSNRVTGLVSVAAGFRSENTNNGTFVWSGVQSPNFYSTSNNQFLVRAAGGVGINTNNPGNHSLAVHGGANVSGYVRHPFVQLATTGNETNYSLDWSPTTPVNHKILATGNVYFATIDANLIDGVVKNIVVTNVFKASSNITVYVQTNLAWLHGQTYTVGASPMHTNYAIPCTNQVVLPLQSVGTIAPSILGYFVHSQP